MADDLKLTHYQWDLTTDLKRRIVVDMLMTPRAIVLAALLVSLAALADAAFPCYQAETLRADAGVFSRVLPLARHD